MARSSKVWLAGVLLLATGAVAQDAPERIELTLPLESGGSVAGTAGALSYLPDGSAQLSGGVELKYRDLVVRAENVVLDLATNRVRAEGNVLLDDGPRRLTGATLDIDLDTKLGSLTEATAAVGTDFYFQGEEVARIADGVWEVRDGVFTSCEGDVPSWSFRVGKATIEEEAYARIRGATMRARTLPVFHLPYLLWPTKTDRSSGLLVPKIGYSDDRGPYLGLAWYQVLGRSYDTTLYADIYGEEYYGGGVEFRWRPSEETEGQVRGFAIQDPFDDEWRWKLELDHKTTNLPWGLRGVAHIEDYSDFDYFRDFERGLAGKTQRQLYSNAFVSGSWGPHSLNVLADRRETFLSGGRVVRLEQLPEIEYGLRKTRLGKLPLFLEVDAAAHSLSVDRSANYFGDYARGHLFPQLTASVISASWLGFTVSGGADVTWWSDSLLAGSPDGFGGGSLTRVVPVAGAEIVGPSFSRIFESSGDGAFSRYKHIIEPRFTWSYSESFDEQQEVPIFDGVDSAGASNLGRMSIVNRLLAKPRDEDQGGAREIASLELARRYSFDDEQALEFGVVTDTLPDGSTVTRVESDQAGPLEMIFRAYPSERLGLRLRADYSMLFSELTNLQLSGDVKLGPSRLSLTWTPSWRAIDGETLSSQGTVGISSPLGERLQFRSQVTWDFEESFLRDQRHFLTWKGSCYAFRLEVHESRTLFERRRDYLFSIDLKNVGTFLDINGGSTSENL
jgi:LPS-assembly protein